MTATRHWFVRQPLGLPAPLDLQLSEAARLELAGNWYLAGETYVALKNQTNAIEKAKVLARAASCFELARDSKVSARLYEEAAREIAALGSDPQLVAELSNRAALQFRDASEFLFAGQAWIRTAEEFSKVAATVINCTENFTPLPMSAFKSHLCGVCFEAAADAYAMAAGHEMMSVGAYWRAANAYSEGPPNIQAFDAYRRSISAHIRQYGTLELDHLRRNVPSHAMSVLQT